MLTRLDNIINNSHSLKERLLNAQTRARKQVEWANGHYFVSAATGEVLTKADGTRLTAADVSRSWYLRAGGRNNARQMVGRLKKTLLHPASVKRFRPKLVTLTFRDVLPSWIIERAIQKFLNAVRTWAGRKDLQDMAYFWTGEVQMKNNRGALHYHIVFLGVPFVRKSQWEAWWLHGFVDVRAVDDLGRVFKYMAKYLWKWGHLAEDAEQLPEWWYYFSLFSKRRYGFSSWYRVPLPRRIPGWLRRDLEANDLLDICIKAKRAPGGGWQVEFHDVEHDEHFGFHIASAFQILEMNVPEKG